MHREGIPYLSVADEAKVWANEERYITGVHEDITIDAKSAPFVRSRRFLPDVMLAQSVLMCGPKD